MRVGNWVEERALKSFAGQEDVSKATTYDRCLRHDDEMKYGKLQSLNSETFSKDALAAKAPSRKGPRAARREAELMERARKEVEEKVNDRRYFTTASQEAYVEQPFVSKVGRRVMKTLSGNPIPKEARDHTFLSELRIGKPQPTMKEDVLRTHVPKGAYSAQEPITVYTQRVSEGIYKSSAGGNTATFGRSAGFTNDITDPRNRHDEGRDDASGEIKGPKAPPKPASGSMLSITPLLDTIKQRILSRAGSDGIHSLSRMLRLMDTSGDLRLSREELLVGLRDFGLALTSAQGNQVFAYFDRDRSGFVDIGELMRGLRGDMSPSRKALVDEAFSRLDKTGDGYVTADDLARAYDVSALPDVASGRMSPRDALERFLSQWDGGVHDGIVTREEFEDYYSSLSATIDNDNYFELMMRNAWHISGGSGNAANTSCRRVLVTHRDGRQTVEEIEDDLGMPRTDTAAMIRFLTEKKGFDVACISLCD